MAAQILRDRILRGDFAPGAKITGASGELVLPGYSKVTIARALIDLEHQGLVVIHPKSGTFVRQFDEAEVYQLWRTRLILEDFFVSTLARDTREESKSGLAVAREIHETLRRVERRAAADGMKRDLLSEAVELDMKFHDQLARAAGYEILTEKLMHVRNQLRLAAGRIDLSAVQLSRIVSDHQQILDAIRLKGSSLIGDVVEARVAISSHLRNGADRMGIGARMRAVQEYANDPIMDVAREVSPRSDRGTPALIFLRILLELLVASEFSRQKAADRLTLPSELTSKMNDIAHECGNMTVDEIPDDLKAEFITSDIRFHTSLAFLSGLMFADEAISHIWQRMYGKARGTLDGTRMSKVVAEHGKILSALAFYGDNEDEPQGIEKVLRQVKIHLFNAHGLPLNENQATQRSGANDIPDAALVFVDWFIDQLSGSRSLRDESNT